MLHQLPDHEVELARKISTYDNPTTPGQIMDEMPDKVMTITPKEGGQFSLRVDFVKDGVGGQSPPATNTAAPPGAGQPQGPLEVTVQLGEWEVMKCLMQSSIPMLVGWDAQVRIAVQNNIEEAIRSGGGYNTPSSY